MFLNNYPNILLSYQLTSKHPNVLHYLIKCYLFAYEVSEWCLIFKITPLLYFSSLFTASLAAATPPVTFLVPLTSMYTSP